MEKYSIDSCVCALPSSQLNRRIAAQTPWTPAYWATRAFSSGVKKIRTSLSVCVPATDLTCLLTSARTLGAVAYDRGPLESWTPSASRK